MLIITVPASPESALHMLRAFAAAAATGGGLAPTRLAEALGRTFERQHPPLAAASRHVWAWATEMAAQANEGIEPPAGMLQVITGTGLRELCWSVRGLHPYDITLAFGADSRWITLKVDRPYSAAPGPGALHSVPSDRQMAAVEELPDSLLGYVPSWARAEVDVRFAVPSAATAAEIWLAVIDGMDRADRCDISCLRQDTHRSCWIVVERCAPGAPVLRWVGAALVARGLPVTVSPVTSTSWGGHELRLTPAEIAEICAGGE